MKLMYCEVCGDIIAPHSVNRQPRWCMCRRHAVWWEDGARGILRMWDAVEGPDMVRRHGAPPSMHELIGYPRRPQAFVLGVTNLLLRYPGKIGPQDVQDIIDAHEDSYIFRRIRSSIIRIRPGESSDTGWARLPEGAQPEDAWAALSTLISAADKFRDDKCTREELNAAVDAVRALPDEPDKETK